MSYPNNITRYLHVQKVVHELDRHFARKRDYKEAINIYERWLIATQPANAGIEDDPTDKAMKEIIEKKLTMPQSLIKMMLSMPKPAHELKVIKAQLLSKKIMRIHYGQANATKLTTLDFEVNSRYLRLIELTTPLIVAEIYLAYKSIISGSQHWGITWDAARWMFDRGFTNEGFASSLNSRLIDFGTPTNQARFCSIMPDDLLIQNPAVRCLGSFFATDLLDNTPESTSWSITPPMIESLI